MALSQIPAPSEPLVHPETGHITRAWFQFFLRLIARLLPNGGPAPAVSGYIVTAPDPLLPDARVATDSATVLVNLATPGEIAWDAIGSGLGDVVGPASATDNAISRFDGTTGKVIQNSGITIADGATGTLAGSNSGDVTLAGTPDYLTIAGQVITRGLIDLATDVTGDLPLASLATLTGTIGIVIDGGGSAITTGLKGYVLVPYAHTITANYLLADVAGSVVVDIWRDSFANYPPTVADTITASAKPTLSAAIKSTDATLTGWSTTAAADSIYAFTVDSAATVTRLQVQLVVTRT